MESGQSSQSNSQPTQSTMLNFCGDNIAGVNLPDQTEQKPNIVELMEFPKSIWTNQPESVHIPWWLQIQNQIPSSNENYVQYLAENPAFVPIAMPSAQDMMLESLALPAYATSCDPSGLSDFQVDLPYIQYLGQDCGSTSNELEAWKHHEDMGGQFSGGQHQAQNFVSWIESSNGDNSSYKTHQADNTPRSFVSAPSRSATQQRSRASKAKTTTNDRQRKVRITEKLNALQGLLPHSEEGGQASILDDIIDYVKYLQLQIKDVCKSKTRMENQSTAAPIIFREGYGHYLCDQEVLSEPLEEVIGKLLDSNPTEAMQLLQMKGLFLMPIEFTQGLASDTVNRI